MGFPDTLFKDGAIAKFAEATKPPYFETSLQKTLTTKKVQQGDIKQNFGFRIPDSVGKELVHKTYHHRTITAWNAFFKGEIERYNNTSMNDHDHMDQLYKDPIGTTLMVGETEEGKQYITFVNLPTITEIDMNDLANYGGPDLSDIFEEDTLQKWNNQNLGNNHWIIASMGWSTRIHEYNDLQSFLDQGQPAIIPDAKHFCGITENKLPRVILLPEFSSAPVGLFWPTDIQLKGLKESLGNTKAYAPFKNLLIQHGDIFEQWLTAVAADPKDFAIEIREAGNMLSNLANPEDVIDKGAMEPLIEVTYRWMWALVDDYYKANTSVEGQLFAAQWERFVENATKRYPQERYNLVHPDRRPFMAQLFYSQKWPGQKPASALTAQFMLTRWVQKWDPVSVSIVKQETGKDPLQTKQQLTAKRLLAATPPTTPARSNDNDPEGNNEVECTGTRQAPPVDEPNTAQKQLQSVLKNPSQLHANPDTRNEFYTPLTTDTSKWSDMHLQRDDPAIKFSTDNHPTMEGTHPLPTQQQWTPEKSMYQTNANPWNAPHGSQASNQQYTTGMPSADSAQRDLLQALTEGLGKDKSKTINTRSRIYLTGKAIATIDQLLETLLGPEDNILWTRPIALIVDRDITHDVLSDASYVGMGGWSPTFQFYWRVMTEDLLAANFPMKIADRMTQEPIDPKAKGLHINPLEFIAALINLWLVLRITSTENTPQGGYILGLWSDNTTCLSWMSVASRTPDPLLQGLARLGASLLCHAARSHIKVCPLHIQGALNHEADDLSRRNKATGTIPTLSNVTNTWSRLQTCKPYLLPSRLLSVIASVVSSSRTEVTYEEVTTELLNLDVRISETGVLPSNC